MQIISPGAAPASRPAPPPAAPPPPPPSSVGDFVEEDDGEEEQVAQSSFPANQPPAPDLAEEVATAESAEGAAPEDGDLSKMSRNELLALADERGVEVNNRKYITAAKLRELLGTQEAQEKRHSEE